MRGGYMDIFRLLLTAVLSVVALFVITKIMGHKQVAQLDFFDYVSGITIGSIGAELATELESPWKPLVALIAWGAVSLLLNFITSRLPRSRKYINGTPTILMHEGKIYRENLKKARLDLSEFLLLCRERGFFDLEDIQTAVFEHNGKLSVLPKAARRPATPDDLKIATREAHIGVELIMDGRIMGENLSRIGREERWLRSEVKRQGYSDESEIFLAIFRESQGMFVYPYE